MNDRVKDDQHLQRNVPVVGTHSQAYRDEVTGVELRVDPPHTFPSDPVVRDVEWQSLDHFVPARTSDFAGSNAATSHPAPSESARTVSRQFENPPVAQRESLDYREQTYRIRLLNLEDEEKRLEHRIALEQAQLETKKNQLLKEETSFAERLIAFELQSQKSDSERAAIDQLRLQLHGQSVEIDRQRADLERQKKALREEALAEIHVEKQNIEKIKAALQKDVEQAKSLKETLTERLNSLAIRNDQLLKGERGKLWQSLTEEYELRKREFEMEQASWKQACDLEKSDIERERAILNAEMAEQREYDKRTLEQDRTEWARTRDLEKSDIDRERAMFESAVETANAEFLRARQTFDQELNDLREQHENLLSQQRADWEQLRDREQAELLNSRNSLAWELDEARERGFSAIQFEREEFEAAIRLKEAELNNAIQLREEEFQNSIRRRDDECRDSIRAEREKWEEYRQQQQNLLDQRNSELDSARANLESELSVLRQQMEEKLAEEKTMLLNEHALRIKAEREEWEEVLGRDQAAWENQQNEFVRERTLIENRIRFQQDHLEKTRVELERAQNEFRCERQVEIQRIEEAGMLLIRRLAQIDMYRSSIDARESSLEREQEVFNRTRKAVASTAEFDRLNFQAEKHAWEKEQQVQQNELRKQQDTLVARAESLESRRIRLDKLRTELEETHRATLEMRLAVEESWAQICQSSGQEEGRHRVEEVRQNLVGYYEKMYESLAEQRREHMDAQAKFERMRTEFADERLKLTAWLTKRDEDLRLGEERLRIAAHDAATNHTKWLSARDRWLLEKTEAEQLIRRLLKSLGENNREQSTEQQAEFVLSKT